MTKLPGMRALYLEKKERTGTWFIAEALKTLSQNRQTMIGAPTAILPHWQLKTSRNAMGTAEGDLRKPIVPLKPL